MNKKELIDAVASATGLSKQEASRIVEIIIAVITRQIANGDDVSIQGFGSFSVKQRLARAGRNPRTGAPIQIAPRTVPSFRFSSSAKKFIDSLPGEKEELSTINYSLTIDEADAGFESDTMQDFEWADFEETMDDDDNAGFGAPPASDFGGSLGVGVFGPGGGGGFGSGNGVPSGAPASAPVMAELTGQEILVPVHYATNRQKVTTSDLNTYYGSERNSELGYGLLNVSIPRSHKKGRLERPGILRLWMESPGKHVMLRSISELPHDMFFASLRGHVARLDKRTAFVFVHGFNCDFAAAARRAAQIAFDLFFQEENDQVAELSVAPILFSWPSEGSAVKYTHDVSNAKSSIKLLQNFLREVVEQSGAEAITLIAHSMGCDLLTAALEKIALAMQAEDGPIIQELILAAPDIDRDYFQQIADQVIRTTRRTTLYASEEDRALFLSRQANGHPRAGDSRNGVVIIEGIDSIDATKVGEDILRHSYVGGATVLGDIFYIIRNGHPPDQRYGLFGQGNPPKRWWAFR